MSRHPLSLSPQRIADPQGFLGGLSLARARVHEAHGPARQFFALLLARAMAGPIFWIAPGWEPGRLYGPGVMGLGVDPGRITFIYPDRRQDLLWTLEEVLRSGLVPLAVAELPEPPALTPMRRLQLAAEAGAQVARSRAPLGLVLTPEGGSAGAESRWRLAPDHRPGAPGWRLTRERDRSAPPAEWRLEDAPDGRMHLHPAEAAVREGQERPENRKTCSSLNRSQPDLTKT